MKHKAKIKLARKMRTHSEAKDGIPIFQSDAWMRKRNGIMGTAKVETVKSTIMQYSITYTGIIVTLLSILGTWLGIPFVDGEVEKLASLIGAFIGIIISIIGRKKAGGVSWFGV